MYTKESTQKILNQLKNNKKHLSNTIDDIIVEEEIDEIIKKLEGDLENA